MFTISMLLIALFSSLCLAAGTGLLATARLRTMKEISFLLFKTYTTDVVERRINRDLRRLGQEVCVCMLFWLVGITLSVVSGVELVRVLVCTS